MRRHRPRAAPEADTFMLSFTDYVYFAVYLILGGVATIGVFFAVSLAFMTGGYALTWILAAPRTVRPRYSAYGGRLDYASNVPKASS